MSTVSSRFSLAFVSELQILDPVTALVVVDVQNDFVDGTLAIRKCPAEEEGADVVPIINHMIDTCHFDIVVYSLDWHPKDHISFVENVPKRKLHHSCKVSTCTPVGIC